MPGGRGFLLSTYRVTFCDDLSQDMSCQFASEPLARSSPRCCSPACLRLRLPLTSRYLSTPLLTSRYLSTPPLTSRYLSTPLSHTLFPCLPSLYRYSQTSSHEPRLHTDAQGLSVDLLQHGSSLDACNHAIHELQGSRVGFPNPLTLLIPCSPPGRPRVYPTNN